MTKAHTLRVPARFWGDHLDRGCTPAESELNRGPLIELTLSDAALADLKSDAAYYTDFIGSPEDFVKEPYGRGICLSARRTLEIIKAYETNQASAASS